MTETKAKRVIVASTVGAVLLLFILITIMVYQMITIQVKKNRIDYLESQIAKYEMLTEQGLQTIETRSMREWIEREARKLGYRYSFDGE